MKKFLSITAAILAVLCILALPAYAGEAEEPPVTEAASESVTETVSETVTETVTEYTESQTSAEAESAVPFDEWLYGLMQEASPEQVEMIEEIVLGGVGTLDKLGIKGFDRFRVWVEHNMATVMVIALTVALVAFLVGTMLQKKGLFKKADMLNHNSIEVYEAGQKAMAEAQKTAAEAKAAMERILAVAEEERAAFAKEIAKNTKVNAALCETVNFLMQCSDLSQSKRDEAEAIFRKGTEAMKDEETNEA